MQEMFHWHQLVQHVGETQSKCAVCALSTRKRRCIHGSIVQKHLVRVSKNRIQLCDRGLQGGHGAPRSVHLHTAHSSSVPHPESDGLWLHCRGRRHSVGGRLFTTTVVNTARRRCLDPWHDSTRHWPADVVRAIHLAAGDRCWPRAFSPPFVLHQTHRVPSPQAGRPNAHSAGSASSSGLVASHRAMASGGGGDWRWQGWRMIGPVRTPHPSRLCSPCTIKSQPHRSSRWQGCLCSGFRAVSVHVQEVARAILIPHAHACAASAP